MSFKPDPNKQAVEIIFTQKRKKAIHPPLFFNGSIVKAVTHHKHLGLILDSKLTYSYHFDEKIGVIKFLSKYCPIKTLNQIYIMYVRPHLDYCDVQYSIYQQ